jgi:hypothetical protein
LNRIDINKAKASDLADFGVAKGLEVNYRMGADKLIAALRTAGWSRGLDRDRHRAPGRDEAGPAGTARLDSELLQGGRARDAW